MNFAVLNLTKKLWLKKNKVTIGQYIYYQQKINTNI